MKITVGLLRAAAEFAEEFEYGGKRYDGVFFQDGYIIGASKGAMLYAPVGGVNKAFGILRCDLDKLLETTDSMKNTNILRFIRDNLTVVVVNADSIPLLRVYPLTRLLPKKSVQCSTSMTINRDPVRPDQAYDLRLLSKIAVAAGHLGYSSCAPIYFCDKTNTAQVLWFSDNPWVMCVVAGLRRTG